MRVLYDITVLGHAFRDTWQRTGVFRVVDELARGLAKSNECELTFCCAANSDALGYALEYVGGDALLSRIPVDHARVNHTLRQHLVRVVSEFRKSAGTRRFRLRLQRKLIENFAKRTTNPSRRALKRTDIFHAPAFHLPPEVQVRNVKSFLTVYDLIPILHPELCREGSTEMQVDALSSLKEDNWVICISEATKNDLCNYLPRMKPERVFVTPLAASAKFHPCLDKSAQRAVRMKYNVPAGDYFLSVCTLEPRKNLEHLIRCFARVCAARKDRDLHLVLVGEKGWKYEKIFDAMTEVEGASSSVVLPGYIADEDLGALYSGALAFVYPSLYEGFGLPPLEAMQAGAAVITSNNSSLPEVIGDAGIMVDACDADALCQAMSDVATKSALREELAKRSLQQAKRFTWEACASATINAYRVACANHQS